MRNALYVKNRLDPPLLKETGGDNSHGYHIAIRILSDLLISHPQDVGIVAARHFLIPCNNDIGMAVAPVPEQIRMVHILGGCQDVLHDGL